MTNARIGAAVRATAHTVSIDPNPPQCCSVMEYAAVRRDEMRAESVDDASPTANTDVNTTPSHPLGQLRVAKTTAGIRRSLPDQPKTKLDRPRKAELLMCSVSSLTYATRNSDAKPSVMMPTANTARREKRLPRGEQTWCSIV